MRRLPFLFRRRRRRARPGEIALVLVLLAAALLYHVVRSPEDPVSAMHTFLADPVAALRAPGERPGPAWEDDAWEDDAPGRTAGDRTP